MHDATAIHGHDIIDLVASHPEGIRLSRLMEMVDERFGKSVTFHTCSAAGMDLDELLHFLEARDKVRITGGVVFPGGSLRTAGPPPSAPHLRSGPTCHTARNHTC